MSFKLILRIVLNLDAKLKSEPKTKFMRCVVIDDDQLSRKVLEKCISQLPELELINTFENALEALPTIKDQNIDLLFLDVEMPEMSGLDLLANLQDPPLVVLVTSKADYAVQAFEHNVLDYIVKPVEIKRFIQAVEKAKERFSNVTASEEDKNHVFIKVDSSFVRLDLREINYIEALGDYIKIYTEDQKFVVLSTMKAIQSKLSSADFFRVHKSYIVRLDKINSIEGNSIPIGTKVIPVSRTYKEQLLSKLKFL